MLYFQDCVATDGEFRLFKWQHAAKQRCPYYWRQHLLLLYNPFPLGSLWITAPFFFSLSLSFLFKTTKENAFLTVMFFWLNNNCKTQLWKKKNLGDFLFLFFSIMCIGCMLMFRACFCKDWMRYCNIPTIAPGICTSQLSINMLKEDFKIVCAIWFDLHDTWFFLIKLSAIWPRKVSVIFPHGEILPFTSSTYFCC